MILLNSCSPSTTAMPSPKPEEAEPAQTSQPVEAAPEPTATMPSSPTPVATFTTVPTQSLVLPTETPVPTTTPTFGPAEEGLSAWCLPEGASIQDLDPLQPPAYARPGLYSGGVLDLKEVPYNGCMFIYQFNRPAPNGLSLEIYDNNQASPWYSAELLPVNEGAQSSFAFVRHSYIIDPPLWQVSFSLVLRDSGGNELRRDQLNLQRPLPELCWNGRLPNINTLRCPLMQDLHPWDAGYRTPFPTPKPEE